MSLKRLIERTKGLDIQEVAEDGSFKIPFKNCLYKLPRYSDLTEAKKGLKNALNGANLAEISPEKMTIFDHYKKAFLQEKRTTGCFHPSEFSTDANPCRRKMYFDYGEAPVDPTYVNFTADNRMQRLVDLGTLAHLYVQYSLYQQGILKDFEVEVVSEEHGISGSMDGVVEFYGHDDLGKFYEAEDMALEVKTINDYGFKSLRYPKIEHIKQASIYSVILKYKRICFVYYNKNTSELKIFVVDVHTNYVADFFNLAKGVISEYNTNKKISRSSDISNHTNLPDRVCPKRSSPKAMECKYAGYCFNHNK